MATPYTSAIVPKVQTKSVSTTAAAIATANQLVMSFEIQNPSSASGVLYVGDSAVAATNCIILGAGDSFSAPFVDAGHAGVEYDLAGWYLRSSVTSVKARILKYVRQQNKS